MECKLITDAPVLLTIEEKVVTQVYSNPCGNNGTKVASFPFAAVQELQIKDESENYRYIFK